MGSLWSSILYQPETEEEYIRVTFSTRVPVVASDLRPTITVSHAAPIQFRWFRVLGPDAASPGDSQVQNMVLVSRSPLYRPVDDDAGCHLLFYGRLLYSTRVTSTFVKFQSTLCRPMNPPRRNLLFNSNLVLEEGKMLRPVSFLSYDLDGPGLFGREPIIDCPEIKCDALEEKFPLCERSTFHFTYRKMLIQREIKTTGSDLAFFQGVHQSELGFYKSSLSKELYDTAQIFTSDRSSSLLGAWKKSQYRRLGAWSMDLAELWSRSWKERPAAGQSRPVTDPKKTFSFLLSVECLEDVLHLLAAERRIDLEQSGEYVDERSDEAFGEEFEEGAWCDGGLCIVLSLAYRTKAEKDREVMKMKPADQRPDPDEVGEDGLTEEERFEREMKLQQATLHVATVECSAHAGGSMRRRLAQVLMVLDLLRQLQRQSTEEGIRSSVVFSGQLHANDHSPSYEFLRTSSFVDDEDLSGREYVHPFRFFSSMAEVLGNEPIWRLATENHQRKRSTCFVFYQPEPHFGLLRVAALPRGAAIDEVSEVRSIEREEEEVFLGGVGPEEGEEEEGGEEGENAARMSHFPYFPNEKYASTNLALNTLFTFKFDRSPVDLALDEVTDGLLPPAMKKQNRRASRRRSKAILASSVADVVGTSAELPILDVEGVELDEEDGRDTDDSDYSSEEEEESDIPDEDVMSDMSDLSDD